MNQTVRPPSPESTTTVAAHARRSMDTETTDAAPPQRPAPPPKVATAGTVTVVAMLLVALAGAAAVLWAWHLWPFAGTVEVTENSYVRGQVTTLSSQVSGYVTEVPVRDFQFVKAGEPLVKVDDRIYRQQLEQAEAQLDIARASLANVDQTMAQTVATVAVRKAALDQATAQLAQVKATYERVSSLTQKGIRAETDLDGAVANLKVAQAGVAAAEANVSLADAQVRAADVSRSGLAAQVRAAEAAVDLARINLGNTVITAPTDGQISESSVRMGQYVTAGTQLMFLVPPARWIVANYKETQTARMRVGQPATIEVDGLDGAALRGTVEELAPAAGSEFSVLKADNASGNFTKVVQRIPVRIRLLEGQPLAERLRPGMSVIARVDTASAEPPAPAP
ncbi:hemolysin secretion protein D [Pleomorphomonas carboxyditropha]|uniref:Hemolysin secretion protein D n=2 Tax=Pleomorphomonas carboxyditropha TaxID=2023338 RepID=A0A2G9WTG8_9HYPH|nr:hemolysin secretion protein D [Pleomorphomonas carboxyditropha]